MLLQKSLYWKIGISKRSYKCLCYQINIPILTEEQSQTCEGPIA